MSSDETQNKGGDFKPDLYIPLLFQGLVSSAHLFGINSNCPNDRNNISKLVKT